MTKPRLLDLFCGAGGAAMGYHRAGFEVVGVDIKPQKNYPFPFILRDALEFMDGAIKGEFFPANDGKYYGLRQFAAIHASPPCQAHSFVSCFNHVKSKHPKLIEPTRERLKEARKPFVIENVTGSPLINPVVLCGAMFGLRVYRHRGFECSFFVLEIPHPRHEAKCTPLKKRTKHKEGEFLTVTGHFAYPLKTVQEYMGIDWMNRQEIPQAIPPAYTEWIGRQLMERLTS
jgi:DNA (cytosine-5)-methyltransferase 1